MKSVYVFHEYIAYITENIKLNNDFYSCRQVKNLKKIWIIIQMN